MEEKRAILMANGELGNLEQVKKFLLPGDTLVAVDGGYRYFQHLGIVPHLLIGDLDSITGEQLADARSQHVEIIKFPGKKDESDLELAITLAVNRGFTRIVIMGGLGGRADHAQVNLSLLLFGSSKTHICMEDGTSEVFLIRKKLILHGTPGDLISLVAIGNAASGISTSGLEYPLKNEPLRTASSRGLSNVMTSKVARIAVSEGSVLCFHTRVARRTDEK